MNNCKIILALFYIGEDWWNLFIKARQKGVNSVWDYAFRIKMSLQNSYIGHYADIKSKICFPHGTKGIFISGGGNNWQ